MSLNNLEIKPEFIENAISRLKDKHQMVVRATETKLESVKGTVKNNLNILNQETIDMFEQTIRVLMVQIKKEKNIKNSHFSKIVDETISSTNTQIEQSIENLYESKLNKYLNSAKSDSSELRIEADGRFKVNLKAYGNSSGLYLKFYFMYNREENNFKLLDTEVDSKYNVCAEIYNDKDNMKLIFDFMIKDLKFFNMINNLVDIFDLKKDNHNESLKFMKEYLFDKPINTAGIINHRMDEIKDLASLSDIKIKDLTQSKKNNLKIN